MSGSKVSGLEELAVEMEMLMAGMAMLLLHAMSVSEDLEFIAASMAVAHQLHERMKSRSNARVAEEAAFQDGAMPEGPPPPVDDAPVLSDIPENG